MRHFEYQGHRYNPEILEDEDTRKIIHHVFLGDQCVGSLNLSPYVTPTLTQFQNWVDDNLKE